MTKNFSIKNILEGVLNSYAQIFFSENKIFAVLLLIVSFFDVVAGFSGLISILTAHICALVLGFDRIKIRKGLYGFNALLVGLGIGVYYEPTALLFLILVISAILTFILTIVFEGFFGKYTLPYLSVPFLIAFWAFSLSASHFHELQISQRGLYAMNDMYLLGGHRLLNIYTWWNELPMFLSVKTYFISLGAIFFQYSILAGILVAIGVFIYSRIAFTLSIVGFYSAYFFYQIIGIEITQITYSYIGFNFILTSIAIGGYFLVPSYKTYFWTIVLVPIITIITLSTSVFFGNLGLSVFSLPFNIVVISFLYVMKSRVFRENKLAEVYIQYGSPEKNLSTHTIHNIRFNKKLQYVPIKLPFWGEWTISQGHNGEITHKNDWRQAWDFIITDEKNQQYKGDGFNLEDYYAFGKNILAPANGYVTEIVDNVEDNKVGETNSAQNWGNVIVIKHNEYLYSKLCHLKKESVKVYVGDYVWQGQVLAQCGNSGRSPYPHLHFQMQATPYIGSKTIEYPLSNYISSKNNKSEFKFYEIPLENERVSNIQTTGLIAKAFYFIVGKQLIYEVEIDAKKQNCVIEIKQDFYGNFYLESENSKAYFSNDGILFQFKHFEGDKNSFLYYFMLSLYNVQLGFYKDFKLNDTLSSELIFNKMQMIIQDFISPFYIYKKGNFSVEYQSIDDLFSPSKVVLASNVEKQTLTRRKSILQSNITISEKGIENFEITFKNKIIKAKLVNE